MKKSSRLTVQIDDQGHLVLPDEVLKQYGLHPGSVARLDCGENSMRISRSVDHLARVYLEPTNACNLDCSICMRQTWDEPGGMMSGEIFQRIIDDLQAFAPTPKIFFGGFGEPLAHPQIPGMVKSARQAGAEVELITNGTLLDEKMAAGLMAAGLNRIWVSLDGVTPESYADVRLGASLPVVLENISRLQRLIQTGPDTGMKFGVAFVAMRKNIADLPALIRLMKTKGADQFSITNVLPYTENLRGEILYQRLMLQSTSQPSSISPDVKFPRMDGQVKIMETLASLADDGNQIYLAEQSWLPDRGTCPFIEKGSLSIRWDGEVAPCLPLLHSHESYLDNRPRRSSEYSFGNIKKVSLQSIWESKPYRNFRRRLMDFDFSPCVICNTCDMGQANLEDCFGNTRPTCGGCLWARGFIQCP